MPHGDPPAGSCTACHESLPGGANFCPSCGQTVGARPSGGSPDVFETLGIESEQERRYLTAVFCDLVGSTELSTTIDPEEFTELIEAYQKHAVAVARRFAGDVEGYSGDGISFRFGWPKPTTTMPHRRCEPHSRSWPPWRSSTRRDACACAPESTAVWRPW